MTNHLKQKTRRGSTVAGLGGLALASVLLLCGAGNAPIENFAPQGVMQADLNAGGHSLTNALTVTATNLAAANLTATNATTGTLNATSLTATSATAGTLNATNVSVSGALTATNFTLPFSSVTGTPTTLGGYGIGDAYTKTTADARYSPLAGSTSLTTLGTVTAGTLPFANLNGTPTTLGGYGIGDAYTKTAADARYSPLAGSTSLTTLGAVTAGTLPFANLTGTPITLVGYGIGDAYTKTAADARYSPLAGSTSLTTLGAVTAGTIPYANLTGNPIAIASGKSLAISNTLTLAGTDGSTLNMGAGGTLGSAAFQSTSAFLVPASIGTTVEAYNAATTLLGNTVNAPNSLVQTDANGLIIDAVLKAGAKTIYVSKSVGNDTRTGLSKYSLITPFATLTAAASAAASGDTIVAEDGVFTDKNLPLVTGVNWYFMPAATITIASTANDAIFKDNGTGATVTISGCGQTFTIATSTAGTSIYGFLLSGYQTTLVVNGISVYANNNSSTGTGTGLASSCNVATITYTGTVTGYGGSIGYGVYFSGTGGGQVTVNGSVVGSAPANGYGFYANGTATGALTCSQRITGTNCAVTNSVSSGVLCRDLVDLNGTSLINNHLTLYTPSLQVQPTSGLTTGFNQAYWYGPVDQILYLTPTGTLASGTVTLPADNTTRVGQRMTIVSTQTITALTVSVASGTIYGWSGGTLSPGSITFLKVLTNVWTKL